MSGKEQSMERFRQFLVSTKNCSDEEICELVRFEYQQGAVTVTEQVRRYYLKTKSENPGRAEELRIATELFGDTLTIEEVGELCKQLYRFHRGFVIHYVGFSYTMEQGKLLKLSGTGQIVQV